MGVVPHMGRGRLGSAERRYVRRLQRCRRTSSLSHVTASVFANKMNRHSVNRTVARIWSRILDVVSDHLTNRRRVLAPIVLVINRSDDEVEYRRRSR